MNILEKSLITIKCLPNMEQEKKSPSQSKWNCGVDSEFLMKGQSGAAKRVFGKRVNIGRKLCQGLGQSEKSRAMTGKSAICTLKGGDEKADTSHICQQRRRNLSFLSLSVHRPGEARPQPPCVKFTTSPSLLTQFIQFHPLLGERWKNQSSAQSCQLVNLPCV